MSDKDFKVKNKLQVKGIASAGPLVSDASGNIDSTSYVATQYGGTGTTTSPSSGQVLYSTSGTTYAPATFTSLPGVYARGNTASRPASPNAGDLYYNTELNYFESYTTNGWFPIAAAPGIPTGVTATNQGSGRAYNDGQSSVAFTASTSGGAPTSFIVTPTPTTSPTTFTGSSSPIIATGLASSTQYTYTVASTSPYGTSSESSASSGVTATTVPQAPTISAVSASETTATITLTAGATGGAAISQYSITSSPATTTQTTSSSPYTFTGLTTGTSYTFTATATNSNGTSLSSSNSNSIIPANPGGMFPLGMVQVGSGGSASISFTSIPATYTHLQIRGFTQQTNNSAANCIIKYNSDSGSNYNSHYLGGNGASVGAGYFTNGSTTGGYAFDSANNGSGAFCAFIIDVLDYANTNKYKTSRSLSGWSNNSNGENLSIMSSAWRNTAAVTSITLQDYSGGSFAQYSSFALYGIKGA